MTENVSNGSGDIKQAEAGSAKQVETTGGSYPITKRTRVKRHCRRFWWAHLIVFLILVLVIVIAIIYGVVPKVAQNQVNDTGLETNSLEILNPTPDSFSTSLNATITGKIDQSATVDEFNVNFFIKPEGEDSTFMTFPIPFNKDKKVSVSNHTVNITDSAKFGAFSKMLLHNESLDIGVTGRTTVHLGAIHTKVNYNKVVTLKGLNDLHGMKITNYTISQDKDANLIGQVMIPNPSVFTLQMGDVNLDIAVDGTHAGTGVIPNLVLTPGNMTYNFRSLIEESQLLTIAVKVATTPLTVTSNGTTFNGQNIPWLSAPLQQLNSSVPVQQAS